MKLHIHSYDSVWSVCDKETAMLINRELSYERVFWIQSFRGKKQVKDRKYLVQCRGGEHFFHTGFVKRVISYLKSEGKKVKYTSDIRPVEHDDPHLKGIKFRKFQKSAFKKVLRSGRGVVKAPTGTGKTIVIAGIVSCFSEENILILIHTNDLVTQTILELGKFGIYATEYSGKKKQISRVTVSTIQSFRNIVKDHIDTFDVIMVDEGHHVSNFEGSYGKVLQMLSAPVKLAVTATMPYKEEAKFALEGLIGPVIDEYKIEEAQKDGVLAIPKIKIHRSEKMPVSLLNSTKGIQKNNGKEPTTYRKHYHNGIANNANRNNQIAVEAETYARKGKSVLISVVSISHGRSIIKAIDPSYNPIFVHGGTKKEKREEVKNQFGEKKLKIVIATTIWQEGINLPSLDVCILAGGGKSDIKVIQSVGRGLRKTQTKNVVTIIDFDDSLISKYLKKHSQERYKIYKEMGWL